MKINLQYKLNSVLAVLLGLSLIIGETIRRYGEWGFWARWMDDYFMGLFLLIPAIMIFKNIEFGKKLLIAGWGINIGMLFGSFFSKVGPNSEEFQSNINSEFLIFLIGLALLVSLVGLIWILILEKKISQCLTTVTVAQLLFPIKHLKFNTYKNKFMLNYRYLQNVLTVKFTCECN